MEDKMEAVKKKAKMAKEGQTIRYNGYSGKIYRITETYRKNILSVKVTKQANIKNLPVLKEMFLFQYPDGSLELMRAE